MAADNCNETSAGVKRPAPPDGQEPQAAAKRSRESDALTLLPDLPPFCGATGRGTCNGGDVAPSIITAALDRWTLALKGRPFGLMAKDCQWDVKRRLMASTGTIVAAAEHGRAALNAAAGLISQIIRSGYAQTSSDCRQLVLQGAWKPALAILRGGESWTAEQRADAVMVYIFLADHVNFYDDFSGKHLDFWSQSVFLVVLEHLPPVVTDTRGIQYADQWELMCSDLEAALKAIGSFMLLWTSASAPFHFDITTVMPTLEGIVCAVLEFDAKFGKEISAKSRGEPLEELTRLSGILAQYAMGRFEDEAARANTRANRRRSDDVLRQAILLLNFLVRMLMLAIPTCAPKLADAASGPSGSLPVDERQQDTEWIEGLWENCQDASNDVVVPHSAMAELFKAMASMPSEEQRYRLECVSPLVPQFIGAHSESLKAKVVPPELVDLKVVLNAVLQDDTSVSSDLLDEVSFYPCLLEFATKRATIHSLCERLKLQTSSSDPIRLVVPRDNVLDGVCSSLNLQDQTARIDVPLEIEFRAGYSDDTGKELVDEGEDQGGLRRQWLDRASRYFISSDLFMSPSEDAAHLDGAEKLAAHRGRSRGLIFVPSPESVCRCVQEDWEEQFELFGCVLGFAILYKETVPIHFGHNFLRSVFGLETDAEGLLSLLEIVDKTLHTKLKYILDGGYQAIGDTLEDVLDQSRLPRVFAVSESHCPELVESTLLKENGDSIKVEEENKEEFVRLLLHQLLISGVAKQVECFRRGLLRVVPDELIQRIKELMTSKEIELMVCGADEVDVADWEKFTQYENGYTSESQPVRWFWDTVRDMSLQSQAALLSFATGSSQVPSGGFRFLQPELFTIQRVAVTDRYPEAHTCVNCLDLPEYSSREELERRLRFSIEEAGDAFGRR